MRLRFPWSLPDPFATSQLSLFATTLLALTHLLLQGLLGKKLAACVNVVPGVTSYYEWEGKMEEDSEVSIIDRGRGEVGHRERVGARELPGVNEGKNQESG